MGLADQPAHRFGNAQPALSVNRKCHISLNCSPRPQNTALTMGLNEPRPQGAASGWSFHTDSEARGLNVENFQRLLQTFHRISSLRRRILVRDVAGESQVCDRFGDKAIIQLLRIVDLMTPGIPARVKMPDPLNV